jgi:hypothetical protein
MASWDFSFSNIIYYGMLTVFHLILRMNGAWKIKTPTHTFTSLVTVLCKTWPR